MYTYKEVLDACLKYFKGNKLVADVWLSKYCLKDLQGNYLELSPLDRYKAIAKELSRIDRSYGDTTFTEDEYYEALTGNYISPGGSSLYGIANPYSITSLSNCFVTDMNGQDSYGTILHADQDIVSVAKRRGGIGVDVSSIRPEGSSVANAAGTSTGIVPFCERFSNTTREVAQSGRRGALMISLSVTHPDILAFIKMKRNSTSVTGANISVRVTNEFMKAVEKDEVYQLRFPVTASKNLEFTEVGVRKTIDKVIYENIKASTIWDELVLSNYNHAEPGILFWDKISEESPADQYEGYKSVTTNPCGEIALSPYDSCRLLSINMTQHIRNRWFADSSIDVEKLEYSCRIATHMMDNIIDLEIEKIEAIIAKIDSDPEQEIEKIYERMLWVNVLKNAKEGRRAGISLVGVGDALAMLNVKYGSQESIDLVDNLYRIVAVNCYGYSQTLAKTRGAFIGYDKLKDQGSGFIQRISKYIPEVPRRNIALLTIPPSGTLSLLWNNQSNGIEPVFSLYYSRRRKVEKTHKNITFVDDVGDCWEDYNILHPYFAEWIKYTTMPGFKSVEELTKTELDSLIPSSPYYKATSMEIDPSTKIDIIAAAQKWVDHSISNTTNLPKDIDIKVVNDLYIKAWKNGLKGFTIYREGSRSGVLNTTSGTTTTFDSVDAVKRPKSLKCDVTQCSINGEKCVILVGKLNNKPYEVFVFNKGHETLPVGMTTGVLKKHKSRMYNLLDSSGNIVVEDIISKFDTPDWEFVTRLISTALRHGTDIKYILEQLSKSKGSVVHVSKAIARQLRKYTEAEISNGVCPFCGGKLKIEGGCEICLDCGLSAKCS